MNVDTQYEELAYSLVDSLARERDTSGRSQQRRKRRRYRNSSGQKILKERSLRKFSVRGVTWLRIPKYLDAL